MREIMLSIVVAFTLTTHLAMAVPPNYGVSGGTHLVGRDGLCLEMFPFMTLFGYFPTRLSQCDEHKRQTQLWNVVGDGTIRPNDVRYCLVANTADGMTSKIAVVTECGKELSNPNQIWNFKKDGTVVHVDSGMVLTGKSNVFVTLDNNENRPSQSWAPTEKISPMIANIQWPVDNLCLQWTEDSNHVGLGGCNNKDQSWAFYGDGTIRQKVNRNYCLTSQQDIDHSIVVSKCEDKAQQRWGLGSKDNTINHPANTDMVMDVLDVPFSTLPLAIYMGHRDGSPTQRWNIY